MVDLSIIIVSYNVKDFLTQCIKSIERFVFGPYASYESAQKKVRNLREKGLEATVAYPKNREVWVPTENKIPINIGNYKIFKEIKKSQIIPFLSLNLSNSSRTIKGIIVSFLEKE